MIGRVGDDAFGRDLRGRLTEEGIDVSAVTTDPETATGIAFIAVNPAGDNSILVSPGANRRLTVDHLREAADRFDRAEALMLQFEVPLPVVEEAAAMARKQGVTVVLDAGPATTCSIDLLRAVDILSPNEREAEALLGVTINDLESARQAAGLLRKKGIKRVVLKLGERGAVLAEGDEVRHFPALKVPVVDTTAAGDAFTAALAVRFAETGNLGEAVDFAVRAGALAVTKLGAQPSLPTRVEVEAL
jgi:ribokinase